MILDTIDSYAPALFFGLLAGDLVLRSRGLARAYALPDSICSISMGVFYTVAAAAIRASVLVAFAKLHRFAPFEFGIEDGPLVWVAAFVAVDFAFYCFHRCLHEVRVG